MLRKPVEDVHYQNKGINQLERNNWEFWVPIFWLLLGWESRSLSSMLECGTFNNDYVDDIGEGNGNPLQYSCLEIPWTEGPGGLQSTGSLRVGHDWANSLSVFTFMHWRRKWQPTPVFLPGESQGRGSLVGCRLWGCTELDTTEVTAAAAAACRWYYPNGGKQRELKRLLIKVKEESEKAGLKVNIQQTKIMASSPLTSWQTDGEENENSDSLYFLGLHSDFGARSLQPWN